VPALLKKMEEGVAALWLDVGFASLSGQFAVGKTKL
jgi:hypothetical protein